MPYGLNRLGFEVFKEPSTCTLSLPRCDTDGKFVISRLLLLVKAGYLMALDVAMSRCSPTLLD